MAKTRNPEIDIDAVRGALKSAESMVRYYSEGLAKKSAENAAMEAAGLPPLHKGEDWDRGQLAVQERRAAALRAVVAYFEPATEAQAA